MDEFNPYISTIDTDYWRDICVREGELRHYKAGEFFLEAGRIGRFIGFIKAGTLKYIVVDSEGNEHIINLEFAGEFVADFPDSIYGLPSKVSIKVNSPSEIYCVSTSKLRNRLFVDKDFRRCYSHPPIPDKSKCASEARADTGIINSIDS